jgi:hypothetical protein
VFVDQRRLGTHLLEAETEKNILSLLEKQL